MGEVVQFVPRKSRQPTFREHRYDLVDILVNEAVRPVVEVALSGTEGDIEAVSRKDGSLDMLAGGKFLVSVPAGAWVAQSRSDIHGTGKGGGDRLVVVDRDSVAAMVAASHDPAALAGTSAAWLATGDAFAVFSYRSGKLVGLATSDSEATLLSDMLPSLAGTYAPGTAVEMLAYLGDQELAARALQEAARAIMGGKTGDLSGRVP